MASPFQHKVIRGNKDLIDQLEDALAEAKAGNLEAVIIVGMTKGDGVKTGGCGWVAAYNNDMLFAWARLVAAIAMAYRDVLEADLTTWDN